MRSAPTNAHVTDDRWRKKWRTLLGIASLLLGASCAGGGPGVPGEPEDPNGVLNVRARLANEAEGVTRVTVHVMDGLGLTDVLVQDLIFETDTRSFRGSLSVPPGNHKIVAKALDPDGQEKGWGEVWANIPQTGSVDVTVNIILTKQVPNVDQNFGPIITAIVITNPDTGAPIEHVGKDQQIRLEVFAHDPDGDQLTYTWSAITGIATNQGTFTAPDAARTEWSTTSGSVIGLAVNVSFKATVSDGTFSAELTSDPITLQDQVGNSNVTIDFLPHPDSLKVTLYFPGHNILSPNTCEVNASPATNATCKQLVGAGDRVSVVINSSLTEGSQGFNVVDSCGGGILPKANQTKEWEWTVPSLGAAQFCNVIATIDVTDATGVKKSGSLKAAVWTKQAP